MARTDYVVLGRVGKPHGLKGEVGMHLQADSPLLLDQLPAIYLGPEKGRKERHAIRSWRPHKGMPLVLLRGVEDRNRAEELRGLTVFARAKDLPDLDDPEQDLYLHELIGLAVRLEDGSLLGTLQDILATGPEQEVWAVVTPDNKEVLLPVSEEVVLEVDPDQERVTVRPPPGLLEIYLGRE